MEGRVVEDKAMRQDLVKTNSGKLIAGKLVTGHGAPLLARFAGKFVLDIMPAALASVIGGFLFTQYQFGQTPIWRALRKTPRWRTPRRRRQRRLSRFWTSKPKLRRSLSLTAVPHRAVA